MNPDTHTPGATPPTADQLATARLARWHQAGEALLTFENLRSWINATGLALYTARPTQIPAPAPSLVEAVLGAPNANPIPADMEQSRSLLARLVIEGIAVPLNLLGTPGETPDFIASAPVFAYIFTLRGDKAWKQPPTTSGALKVSPLALATYEMLVARHTLSACDLATQLGKEVTESAVLRALNELWVHLRVLPIPQPDGAATLWEPAATRFTKLMKAGANAGQPSALSALISLYLNTAIVATEEEIETFISPLAARSRIRDVVHALMAARQLETLAVDGRTVLHVGGELPAFLAPEGSVLIDAAAADTLVAEPDTEPTTDETIDGPVPRIAKFVPKPRKTGTGYVAKPMKPAFGKRPAFGADKERRPFTGRPGTGKPSFSKPWQEGKSPAAEGQEGRSFTPTPRPDRGGDRPAFGQKPAFGSRPSFASRPSFGSRPDSDSRPSSPPFVRKPRDAGEGRPPRREFTPRPEGSTGDSRPPRKPFALPGGFAGKSSSSGAAGDARPPRRDFPPRSNAEGGSDTRPRRRDFGERPAFRDRPASSERPAFKPRPAAGDRPAFGGPRKPGSFSARPQGSFGDRKPFTPREGGPPKFGKASGSEAGSRGAAGNPDRRSRTSGPPFRKFDAPRRPAGDSTDSRPPRPGGFAGKKPFGKPAGGKFAGKPGTGKPAGTFDKFKNNAKPFGNRPPARKYKPEEGEPSA